jgi:oligopeptide transport system permease protein
MLLYEKQEYLTVGRYIVDRSEHQVNTIRKTLILIIAGLGTLVGVFLLSNVNDAFMNYSPELLKVSPPSSVNLKALTEKYPELTIEDADKGIIRTPYGKALWFYIQMPSITGFLRANLIPIEPTFSMKKYTFELKQKLEHYSRGDFGTSVSYGSTKGNSFKDQLKKMIPRTLTYLLPALLFSILLGVVFSLLASMKKSLGKFLDGIHMLLMGLPDFFVIVLIQLFAIYASKFTDKRLILVIQVGNEVPFLIPFLAITIIPAVLIYGTMRTAIERELSEAYVVTAYAKGLGGPRVLLGHVFRNVLEDLLAIMPKATTIAVSSMAVAEVLCNIVGVGGYIIRPFFQDVSALPLMCTLLAVFTISLHGIFALIRKLLVVNTKEVA